MSLNTHSRAVSPTEVSSSNVVALRRPDAIDGRNSDPGRLYQVRVGGKIFQGGDLRSLLRLAVQARRAVAG